ncbi:MAG: ATPase, T2SS/T4P/T4SS family, partial [Gammaproteobacteria bacterium]
MPSIIIRTNKHLRKTPFDYTSEKVLIRFISASTSSSFVTYLVTNQLASARSIALAASDEFGVPFFMLEALDLDAIPKDTVPEKLIRQHHALPLLRRGNRLFIAVSDPTNLQGIDEIKFNTGLSTEPILAEDDKLSELIETFLDSTNSALDIEDDFADLDVETDDGLRESSDDSEGANDAPIVKFVNKVLLDAIRGGASDIHFEPYEKAYRVRFRQDGVLREITKPPTSLAGKIAARLKVMSRMDISERRIPQDGRIKLKLSKKRAIDFRVNTLPTLWGEKICLRILDPDSAKLGIDLLGYEPEQKELYMNALSNPYGMILVT